jgi:hypothetical protein
LGAEGLVPASRPSSECGLVSAALPPPAATCPIWRPPPPPARAQCRQRCRRGACPNPPQVRPLPGPPGSAEGCSGSAEVRGRLGLRAGPQSAQPEQLDQAGGPCQGTSRPCLVGSQEGAGPGPAAGPGGRLGLSSRPRAFRARARAAGAGWRPPAKALRGPEPGTRAHRWGQEWGWRWPRGWGQG